MYQLNFTELLSQLEILVEYAYLELLLVVPKGFGLVIAAVTISFMLFIYWLYYVPSNWIKGIDDVGFSMALNAERKLNSIGKKDVINRLRKMRKIGAGELPPPYPNGWYGIMESSQLKPGESTSVSCLGEHFVIYRTLEKEVFILDAYCPHLGANLGVGGRVVGKNIECPFHRWSFRGTDGVCTNIPYSTCVPHGIKVKKWISRETTGFIFVWYHAENEGPWQLPIVDEIENKEFVYHGRNEFYVNCHIQEIPENGADLAHFTAIHNASVLAGGSNPNKSILANAGNHHWQALWKPNQENNKQCAAITLTHLLELTTKFHCFRMDVVGQQIGPSYVQLHMKSPLVGKFEVIQAITPIEPLVQKVVHRFYGRRALGPFMKFAVFAESVMFERDMAMWNHKMFRSKPQLVKEDALLKQFRCWYSQFFTPNSKTFAEACNNMDW